MHGGGITCKHPCTHLNAALLSPTDALIQAVCVCHVLHSLLPCAACALHHHHLFPCRHEFPQWRPQDLTRAFPSLEESGLELLRAMLQYDPARRISVSGLLAEPVASLYCLCCLCPGRMQQGVMG